MKWSRYLLRATGMVLLAIVAAVLVPWCMVWSGARIPFRLSEYGVTVTHDEAGYRTTETWLITQSNAQRIHTSVIHGPHAEFLPQAGVSSARDVLSAAGAVGRAAARYAAEGDDRSVDLVAIGWPLPSCYSIVVSEPDPTWTPPTPNPFAPVIPVMEFPGYVMPVPTLINALVFLPGALVLWIIGRLARRAVRALRRRPGDCPQCRYNIQATPGRCPECGWSEPVDGTPESIEDSGVTPRCSKETDKA